MIPNAAAVVSAAPAGNKRYFFSDMMQRAAGLLYERGAELAIRMTGLGRKPRIAVINGIQDPALNLLAGLAGELVVQQHRRDTCLELQRAGHMIRREIREGPFDIVLVLSGRQREQTMGWIAGGARLLDGSSAPFGGVLVTSAANDMGARGYEKRLSQLSSQISVSSKSKCRLASLHGDDIEHPEVLDAWLAVAAPRQLASGLISCPGVFSWDHPDAGSRLLLEHLPAELSGRGMDLGCGNGYLSHHVLSHYAGIKEWHAVDVDAVALDCAAQNLQGLNLKETMGGRSVQTHWMDATRENMPGGMDVILLNPPFHRDKADLVSLGQAMIMAAKQSMDSSGSLFLVANRHLPYELLLYENFEQVRTLFDGDGYKVIRCDGVQE